jgi:hypothetical protein
MKFLIEARSIDETYTTDIRFAWVDISSEVATAILRRARSFELLSREHRQLDGGALVELIFRDASVRYFREDVPPLDDVNQVDGNGDFATTSWDPGGDEGERTTGDVMIVSAESVHWRCSPRHWDFDIVTDAIPLRAIEQCLGRAA